MKHLKIGDIVILFLILSAALFISYKFSKSKSGKVIVTANNQKYVYSLSTDSTYSVPGYIGNTVFEIKEGKVRIIDSPCPNKTCIQMGWSDSLICLPNQVFISIENIKDNGGLDAISK